MNRRWIVQCTILLLPFAMVGCSSPDTGTVSGTAKMNGAPLAGCTVMFHGKDRGGSYVIDEDGSYNVQDAPVGLCKVTIKSGGITPPGGFQGKAPVDPVGGKASKNFAIPPEYTDPAKTPLSFEVKPGKSSFPIDIK
jgi:hypothetical protein